VTGDTREDLRLMSARAESLKGMVDALAEYSLLHESDVWEEVDAGEACREALARVRPPSGIEVVIEPGLPRVRTRPGQLRRVFECLLENAVRHRAKRTGTIHVSGEEEGAWAWFRVDDDGPGIPPEHRDRIFRLFHTLSPKRQEGARGVGLAVSRRIVSLHGGTITVESSPLGGAGFRFSWPSAN